jgi:predicted amidohydrolase YtcJ
MKSVYVHGKITMLFLLSGLAAGLGACQRGSEPKSEDVPPLAASVTLVHGARLYTFDQGNTAVDTGAMAFSSEGEILAIGDDLAIKELFANARRIDLSGRTVLPGLIDAHGHLYGLALSLSQANLVGTGSKAEVIERLQAFAGRLQPDEWLLGRGWDQNDWPEQDFPSRADLDAAFPKRPVWLRRIDGHAAWGNSQALAQADRDLTGEWQPQGGLIHRDARGEPTGVFIDHAMGLIDEIVPPPSDELVDAALDLALDTMVSLGLTGVHDPGVDRGIIERYRRRIAAGRLPVRVYALVDGPGPTLDWLCKEGLLEDASGFLAVRSVKLYADGALGSRGAALLSDYHDDPGNRGLLFSSDEGLEEHMRRALSCGLQLGIHAIGDRANRQALDAFERLLPQFADNPGRHRVEHAQILDPADIPRFARLGVIAAVQPTHATSDMYWAGERLGPERLGGAYAWRSLLQAGARLAFGSDFPVEEVNPMLGIHAAVTRQDLAAWPPGGWLPGERLTRSQAIRAFTLDAAFAAFMEDMVGSLEVGKRADFIVLERDVMNVPAEQIPVVRVLETWVDGRRVFQR